MIVHIDSIKDINKIRIFLQVWE